MTSPSPPPPPPLPPARRGHLVPLKTGEELQAAEETTIDFYVLDIPAKSAHGLLNHLRQTLPPETQTAAHRVPHLRRLVKPDALPWPLRRPQVVNGGERPQPAILHLLVCAASTISAAALGDLLLLSGPECGYGGGPEAIRSTAVPCRPPASEAQAREWSARYWPTVYKGDNPYGPHPSIVARALAELAPDAGTWMALAHAAARRVRAAGVGEAIGAVVVDRRRSRAASGEEALPPVAVAVAGDARWHDGLHHHGPGDPGAHAAMRVIGMVARKRRQQENDDDDDDTLLLNALEREIAQASVLPANGYLCTTLDVYLTHEPCVMCAMALLHSRVRCVVFGRRMPCTGALTADGRGGGACRGAGAGAGGLGYGLFWRPHLNWKFLAFEWCDDDPDPDPDLDGGGGGGGVDERCTHG
ncbi:MAG: tRNA-specific adenosine deaminase subunit tad3 [Phylliscum demangeonii]|nr:MAG: tRNA-specific adenosine deaminase subunit tad3 [Phylliscum demangeonii]